VVSGLSQGALRGQGALQMNDQFELNLGKPLVDGIVR
jgi:hypothetical protein